MLLVWCPSVISSLPICVFVQSGNTPLVILNRTELNIYGNAQRKSQQKQSSVKIIKQVRILMAKVTRIVTKLNKQLFYDTQFWWLFNKFFAFFQYFVFNTNLLNDEWLFETRLLDSLGLRWMYIDLPTHFRFFWISTTKNYLRIVFTENMRNVRHYDSDHNTYTNTCVLLSILLF